MAQARIREKLKRIRDHRKKEDARKKKKKADRLDELAYALARLKKLQAEGKLTLNANINDINGLTTNDDDY